MPLFDLENEGHLGSTVAYQLGRGFSMILTPLILGSTLASLGGFVLWAKEINESGSYFDGWGDDVLAWSIPVFITALLARLFIVAELNQQHQRHSPFARKGPTFGRRKN